LVKEGILPIAEEDAMSKIIAGRFEQQTEVELAREELLRAGFPDEDVITFYVNPAGQHDRYVLGGDRNDSPGTERSHGGLARGGVAGGVAGAAIGAATAPVLGPVGPVAGALVGAHVGDLIGSLSKMQDDGEARGHHRQTVRKAGLLVAVAAHNAREEERAVSVLRSLQACDIERAEGTITNGDWVDFDPLLPPTLVDRLPTQRSRT
jgi:hypothetical protein